MSVYVTKEFARFAQKARVADAKLLQAARDVAAGHYDPISAVVCSSNASPGKAVVSRVGPERSSGSGSGVTVSLPHGFAKSDKANVSAKELKALKRLADVLLGFSKAQLEAARVAGELIEVQNDGDVKEKD